MRVALIVGAGALLLSTTAFADRRALSADISAGWQAGTVVAPNTDGAAPINLGPSVWLGARYGLSNNFEVTGAAFFETPTQVGHSNVVLHSDTGDFSGTLIHRTMRFGGLAGARAVFGMTWRFHLGLELGWGQRLFTGRQMVYEADGALLNSGLMLPDTSRGNFILSPVVGLEFAAGDHWSFSLMPRAQLLLGNGGGWSVIVPLQFSWNWYL